MAHLSVRHRLVLSFLVILALFATNQVIGIWSDRVRSQAIDALNKALARRVLTASVRQQLADLHKEVTLLGEVRFEPGSVPDPAARLGFESKLAHTADDVSELSALSVGQDSVDTGALEQNFAQVAELWKKFYEYLGVEQAWSVASLARADPLTQRLLGDIIPRLETEGNRAAAIARADFERVTARARAVTLVIFLSSVTIGIIVASRVSSYLVGRLVDLGRGADLIGAANLQHRIAVEPRDEMGELAEHFNEMAAHLDATQTRLRSANDQLATLNRLLSERIEEELAKVRLAAFIQRDLLPKEPPLIDGYRLAGQSVPAQTVGGDYFDFIPMDDRSLALCVGDVSGKGLPASLLMANLQAAVRSQVLACASVTECLRRTNTLLFRSTDAGKFVTAFFCVLDYDRHELRYSNAGHNPPMLFRSGREPERLEVGGLVLGIFDGIEFEESACRLERGDLLVVYSDGISEAPNADGVEFGEEGIIAVVNRERHSGPAEVLDAILKAAMTFSSDQLQLDDMTIIVLQRV
jgi:serine phosphatase RsbU (regulator of sigma subunit)